MPIKAENNFSKCTIEARDGTPTPVFWNGKTENWNGTPLAKVTFLVDGTSSFVRAERFSKPTDAGTKSMNKDEVHSAAAGGVVLPQRRSRSRLTSRSSNPTATT